MPVTNEQLVATLSANVRKFEKAMDKAANKADRSFTKIERRGKKMERVISRINPALNFSGLAKFGGAVGFGALTREFVSAASDAEELNSKFSAVFKDLTNEVDQWAINHSEKINRSSQDIKGYLSTLQDTFVPLGFAREQGAELSKQLTELAIDVASFSNASEPDVLRNFTSAIVGNHEAVRSYGIVITAATLKAELMRMGIKGGTQAATEQQKVLARLNLIMGSTSDAQGDAARTAGSFANQTRGLEAAWKDFSIQIGQFLTGNGPAILDFLSAGIKQATIFLERFKSLSKQSVAGIDQQLASKRLQLENLLSDRDGDSFADVIDRYALNTFGDGIDNAIERVRSEIRKLEEAKRALDDTEVNGPEGAVFTLPPKSPTVSTKPKTTPTRSVGKPNSVTSSSVSEAKELKTAIEELETTASQAASSLSNLFSGVLNDMLAGRDATDSLKSALSRLASQALDQSLQSLFVALLGGGGIGAPLNIIPGLASGGPMTAGKPYLVGERGPELVVPRSNGQVIPNHQLGSSQSFVFSPTLHAQNSNQAEIAELKRSMQDMHQNFERRVASASAHQNLRGHYK